MFVAAVFGQVPEPYDCVEVFAGCGNLSRCLSLAGYRTASLDVAYWKPWKEARHTGKRLLSKPCSGNALDLLTPAGVAFLDAVLI